MRLAELLAELDELQADDARRPQLNAQVRAEFAADENGARTFLLTTLDVCDPAQALHAMAIVEALAGDPDRWIALLQSYFDAVATRAAECPSAITVLTAYAFLEHGSGKRKSDLLPRYVALTRANEPELRRAAIELLAGFEISHAPGVRDALLALLRDDDWRVRRDAEALMREAQALPPDYRTPIGDRMRRMFGS